MEDLRTGYYEKTNYREEPFYGNDSSYDLAYGKSYGGKKKEDEILEEKFALYKLQNIIAVVAVIILIIMDIFQIHVGNIGSQYIFEELARSFTVQELWGQLTQIFTGLLTLW